MTTKQFGVTEDEQELRQRLVAQLHSGEKTLEQIQQELRDYKNPEAAELRRFREREPLVQKLISYIAPEDPGPDHDLLPKFWRGFIAGLGDIASEIRDFAVRP